MPRLIDADALLEKMNRCTLPQDIGHTIASGMLDVLLRDAPAIDPVRHGEWRTNSDYPDRLICSVCGYTEDMWWADKGTLFCSACGSKMDGVDE